jgi:hypothetical protein
MGHIWHAPALSFLRTTSWLQALHSGCVLESCKVWLVPLHRCIALHYVQKYSKSGLICHLRHAYSSKLATSTVITISCNTTLHALQQHTIPTSPSYSFIKLEWFKGRAESGQKWPLGPLLLRKLAIWISTSKANWSELVIRRNWPSWVYTTFMIASIYV